jgi:hypothetical protein
MRPCGKCRDLMTQGVLLISVRNGEDGPNPFRTGGWVLVRDEMIQRLITPASVRDEVLRLRWAFLDDQTWDLLGLPREAGPPP